MQDLLQEGYGTIAEESRRIAEEFKILDKESLQYVDSAMEVMTRNRT